jgi:hypothetical protein
MNKEEFIEEVKNHQALYREYEFLLELRAGKISSGSGEFRKDGTPLVS